MNIENINFLNNRGQRLHGKIYYSEEKTDTGVIFCHGLFSSKDGRKIRYLAEDIAATGMKLLSFDFSFSGESDGPISDILISQEVEDLKYAVQFFHEQGVHNIHFIGSSMGAVVSIIFVSSGTENIVSLITIAAPVDLTEVIYHNTPIKSIEDVLSEGAIKFDSIKIKNSFFKELLETDLTAAVRKIMIPVLIIHGEDDNVVDPKNAEIFSSCLVCKRRLVLIKDGGHTLTRAQDLSVLKKNIVAWLKHYSVAKV